MMFRIYIIYPVLISYIIICLFFMVLFITTQSVLRNKISEVKREEIHKCLSISKSLPLPYSITKAEETIN